MTLINTISYNILSIEFWIFTIILLSCERNSQFCLFFLIFITTVPLSCLSLWLGLVVQCQWSRVGEHPSFIKFRKGTFNMSPLFIILTIGTLWILKNFFFWEFVFFLKIMVRWWILQKLSEALFEMIIWSYSLLNYYSELYWFIFNTFLYSWNAPYLVCSIIFLSITVFKLLIFYWGFMKAIDLWLFFV